MKYIILFSRFCSSQNIILHKILKNLNSFFECSTFYRMHYFFSAYGHLLELIFASWICSISIFIYHLTSEDKSVRILGFLVWKQLFETLKTKLFPNIWKVTKLLVWTKGQLQNWESYYIVGLILDLISLAAVIYYSFLHGTIFSFLTKNKWTIRRHTNIISTFLALFLF